MIEESATETAPATLFDVLTEYLETLTPADHNTRGTYVRKYVDYAGGDFQVSLLTGARVELYAESQIKASDPRAADRVAALKAWFVYLKKKSYTEKNLGVHIRVRKSSARGAKRAPVVEHEEALIEMTEDGLESLKHELDELKGSVSGLVEAVALAREDKDFRENAPLDAAREAMVFNQQRRREVEETLKRAVVVDARADVSGASSVGSIVQVRRLDDDLEVAYQLVSAHEADAAEKKISIDSPVGKELLGRRAGDQVSVYAPKGVIEFEIKSVSR